MERRRDVDERDAERGLAHHPGDAQNNIVSFLLAAQMPRTAQVRDFRLHRLLDALPAAVYTTDAAGRITYYNDAAAALWGRRPVPDVSEWCGALKLYWPDGTSMAHAECPMAVALREQRPMRGVEAVIERPDGTRVPFTSSPTPLFSADGTLTGAINMLIDISERKQAEHQQAVLVRELHHRVKNTLATVQAIMGSTARTTNTIEEFTEALNGRIGSLARTHLLLSEEPHGAIEFADILHKELAPFDSGNAQRIRLSGAPAAIPRRLAVVLGMAIHELATNAAKYGALSLHGGTVTARWRVVIGAGRRMLEFDWMENGGPPVAGPQRSGFGTRLLEMVLPAQVQARTRIEYARTGVCVHYSVPLMAETAE